MYCTRVYSSVLECTRVYSSVLSVLEFEGSLVETLARGHSRDKSLFIFREKKKARGFELGELDVKLEEESRSFLLGTSHTIFFSSSLLHIVFRNETFHPDLKSPPRYSRGCDVRRQGVYDGLRAGCKCVVIRLPARQLLRQLHVRLCIRQGLPGESVSPAGADGVCTVGKLARQR